MKKCYFKGCKENGNTKEHIPPKSFFPADKRKQLLTVSSCPKHNNSKSENDLYVLAHICLNSSPKNDSNDIFVKTILPQLEYNSGKFKKMLLKESENLKNGARKYKVDINRFDNFFDSLSCGILYKVNNKSLPIEYNINHIYHNFIDESESIQIKNFKELILNNYVNEKPQEYLNFGEIDTHNKQIYDVKIFGIPNYESSITIVHNFYDTFKVTSMINKY